MGHSRGGAACLLFASLFPKHVEKVIVLDAVRPISVPTEYHVKSGGERITTYLRYEKQYMEPGTKYTPGDALEIVVNGHNGSITEDSAKILMKRGTKRTPDGSIYFTRDLRLKSDVLAPLTIPELKEFMSNVSCELLIISALKGPYFMEKKDKDEFLEIYKNNCKKFVYKEVNGTHHVHLNEPEMVAPIINSFLQNMNGKL